jgi:ribosomal protein S27AE
MTQYACPRCGAVDLVTGSIQSTGAVRFRPAGIKFMTLHTADVSVRAHMCVTCGALTLLGDTEKLRLVRSAPVQGSST